jgi:hypothetical protein
MKTWHRISPDPGELWKKKTRYAEMAFCKKGGHHGSGTTDPMFESVKCHCWDFGEISTEKPDGIWLAFSKKQWSLLRGHQVIIPGRMAHQTHLKPPNILILLPKWIHVYVGPATYLSMATRSMFPYITAKKIICNMHQQGENKQKNYVVLGCIYIYIYI